MMEEVDLASTPLVVKSYSSQSSSELQEESTPDPRIQIELEKLNTSTDLINKLEVELDDARQLFRQSLSDSTQRIDNLTKRLGKCIEHARPYYDARMMARQALAEAQNSTVRYERAVSQHTAAREMVQLAEEGLITRGCLFDSTWQEMLNHATTKVNEAEVEKCESASEHHQKYLKYHDLETRVKFLQKELKRSIAKSSLNARRSLLQMSNVVRMQELQLLPYFELKAAVNHRLEGQKIRIKEIEKTVLSAKKNYAEALSSLEKISNEIHKTRQLKLDLGIRGSGVGAESPCPPSESIKENRKPTSIVDFPVEFSAPASLTHFSRGNFLTVDDNESILSDTESIASCEMLSEEAIENLMLEVEIREADRLIASSQTAETESLSLSGKGTASLNFLPGLLKGNIGEPLSSHPSPQTLSHDEELANGTSSTATNINSDTGNSSKAKEDSTTEVNFQIGAIEERVEGLSLCDGDL